MNLIPVAEEVICPIQGRRMTSFCGSPVVLPVPAPVERYASILSSSSRSMTSTCGNKCELLWREAQRHLPSACS